MNKIMENKTSNKIHTSQFSVSSVFGKISRIPSLERNLQRKYSICIQKEVLQYKF